MEGRKVSFGKVGSVVSSAPSLCVVASVVYSEGLVPFAVPVVKSVH